MSSGGDGHPLRAVWKPLLGTWLCALLLPPAAFLLAWIATAEVASLGARWRRRADFPLMAALLPGGLTTCALALGHGSALGAWGGLLAATLGPLVLGAVWLARCAREVDSPEARRSSRGGLFLALVLCATTVPQVLLLDRWQRPPFGTSPSLGPSLASPCGLSLLIVWGSALVLLVRTIWRAASWAAPEAPRQPASGSLWIAPRAGDRALGEWTLLGVGGALTVAIAVLPWLPVPHPTVPAWPLAPLVWAVAALVAEPRFAASSDVWASRAGLLADGRDEPWARFTAWEVEPDRIVLSGPGLRRVLLIGEDDPRRAQVTGWIEEAGLPR